MHSKKAASSHPHILLSQYFFIQSTPCFSSVLTQIYQLQQQINLDPMSYSIKQMKEEHLDQVTQLLAKCFLAMNPIWMKYSNQNSKVFPYIRGNIIPSVSSGWAFLLFKDKKVVGAAVQYDFYDYLRMTSMPSDLELFRTLGSAGKKLQSSANLSQIKHGQALYGLYGAIDPSQSKKGISIYFWWLVGAINKLGGWKYQYSRVSNPVSLKMMIRLGAQIVSETEADGEKIWLVKVNLLQHSPPYSLINQLSSHKKKEISPKL